MTTDRWGARVPPAPLSFPGFANAAGLEGPTPNAALEAAWLEWWLELDRSTADAVRAVMGLPVSGETISFWAARAAKLGEPWGLALCGFLNGIDPGHCQRALAKDGTA